MPCYAFVLQKQNRMTPVEGGDVRSSGLLRKRTHVQKIPLQHKDEPPATLPRSTDIALRPSAVPPAARWRRFVVKFVALALIWAILTDFRADALVFGLPAVVAGAALVFLIPVSPGWRLSPRHALSFAVWFSVQSVRGAVDVALRAFAPSLPLRPGFRTYTPSLPKGAPRIMFLNTITLLPGTMSAELLGDAVCVHMLDTTADLEADLRELEARVAALFTLTSVNEVSK